MRERKAHLGSYKLTPAQREALAQEIRDLRENDPRISVMEIGRRLALKWGVTGSTVRGIADMYCGF